MNAVADLTRDLPDHLPQDLIAALTALRQGRPVLVLDDEDREAEGDVVLAAQTLEVPWLAWTIRHTSGYLCAPMTGDRANQLDLPLMVPAGEDPLKTAYSVSVDAAQGVTTGISAADRSHTLRTLAEPGVQASDLIRPGHVLPLRARPGGVLERPGHTEAAVDLCRLAGLVPVGAIAELVHEDGHMMRRDAVQQFAAEHDLPVVDIASLSRWRSVHDRVDRLSTSRLPTQAGVFTAHAMVDRITGTEHLALVADGARQPSQGPAQRVDRSGSRRGSQSTLVRLHSECLTGDALGSVRCDCGAQLAAGLAAAAEHGGVVVYLRGHEGRGVGLGAKIAAYARQDAGADTVDAQHALGLPVDARDYAVAAAMLAELGVERVELMTNNPAKVQALRELGLDVVGASPAVVGVRPENLRYLRTKRDRLGHTLPPDLEGLVGAAESASSLNAVRPAGDSPTNTSAAGRN